MVEERTEYGGHVAFAVEKANGNWRNIRAYESNPDPIHVRGWTARASVDPDLTPR